MSRENTVPTLTESGSTQLLMTLKSAITGANSPPYSQDTEIEPVIVSALNWNPHFIGASCVTLASNSSAIEDREYHCERRKCLLTATFCIYLIL
jgi:hypothetical protein